MPTSSVDSPARVLGFGVSHFVSWLDSEIKFYHPHSCNECTGRRIYPMMHDAPHHVRLAMAIGGEVNRDRHHGGS